MSKRPRSSGRQDPADEPTSSPPPSLVEEVVVVEETCDVLVRFPCFDFFHNVHLCERKHAGSTEFVPENVQFVPDSLASDHPILVVDPCTDKEMIFACSWAEVCTSDAGCGLGTNRALVHVRTKAQSDTQQASHDPAQAENRPDNGVASLLAHVAGGVSADAVRAQQLNDATRADMHEYDLITAPTAILVAQRLR